MTTIALPVLCTGELKTKAQVNYVVTTQLNVQCLCFRCIESAIPLIPKSEIFKPLVICDCTASIVWDLVRNPNDRFFHDAAHMIQMISLRISVAVWI